MNNKAKRAKIQIAGIEVEVFQLPDGEYVMSQSQVASAVKCHKFLMSRFLDEQWLEGKLYKDYRCHKIDFDSTTGNRGGNGKINIIPVDLASEFWLEQSFRGNIKAQALVQACLKEALERRCDKAFGKTKTEKQYEQEAEIRYQTWEESRDFLRDAHSALLNACRAWTFDGAKVHDMITIAVCGKTARELRELDVINGNPQVGLNHIENRETLVKIARLKVEFSRYRSGTAKERINRAIASI